MLEIKSFVRGFHAYKDIWTPEEGERLNLIREPENIKEVCSISLERRPHCRPCSL